MPESENLHINNSADLRNLLNSNQYDAVTYTDGPSVIVAGAGSGKTRVLTYKVAYLLQQGWHPGQILALTFTNKAAKEMKSRISKLVGEKSTKYLWVGTFHAIFSKILRYESKHIGFTSDFTIYDSSDSKSLIRSLVKELQLDDKIYKANNLQSRISFAKNQLVSPTDYANDSSAMRSDLNSRTPRFLEVYQLYCQRCRNSNAMDFDDLLIYTNTLFEKHPEILAKYQTRFGYILVDEYQDTNRAQHLIVSKLAAHHQRICVVGDDAQSIYSFRGANIDNMLLFQRQYEGCKLFKLEQNYRSTQTIVNAANSLISKNEHQIRKNVFSDGDIGKLIKVLTAYSDYDEAFTVANSMHESIKETKDAFSDYAILYRTNAQSRTLEEALRKRAIPYKIYGGVSFYQRKEVKDILAYLRLIINPNDEESFKRIINYPIRGVGETTLQKILKAAHEQSISPLKLIQNLADFTLDVNKGMVNKLQNFSSLMDQFIALNEDKDAYVVAEQVVLATGIMRDISIDSTPENLSRKENVQELLSAINQFCEEKANAGDIELKLVDFLSEVALLTDQDLTSEENQNHITMMTVHAAKGLEFKHVYIVGLE
ncbi:MAG TPA: UvrD-helicase domain-containing protein, partial [Paludibacteraceae bacterium]|nr:UvrD-helicase domain-containing protein [Paludibacteraceae bacterium]